MSGGGDVAGGPSVAASPLGTLAQALTATGWRTAWAGGCHYAAQDMLRVWHPALPVLGDTVSVAPGTGGTPWFWSSTGAPLAPCIDVPAARDAVVALLAPYVATATRGPARPPSRSASVSDTGQS